MTILHIIDTFTAKPFADNPAVDLSDTLVTASPSEVGQTG